MSVAVLDAIPDPFYTLDPELRVTYVNHPALVFWGMTSEQVIGRCLWDLFPQVVDTPFGEHLRQAVRSRRVTEFELLSPRSHRWQWERVSPLPNGHTAVSWRDTTERRRIEAALRASNERLEQETETRTRELAATRARMQAFFDNSLDWLSLFRRDAQGGFRYVDLNAACAAAYGLPRTEVIGRRVEDILGAEQAVLPLHHLDEAARSGSPQRYHVRRTLAGRTRAIDVVFVPVEDEAGAQPLILSTARDLTERTNLEEQLRQALKMEAVGQLTGGVAHDFNNLLTAVISSLELIQRRSSEEKVQALSRTALRAAMRGAELTSQLLAFSRRQTLRPSIVDLGVLLTETTELLTRTVGETVELLVEIAPDLWLAKVDAAQFQTAVMNLVVNARDAMAEAPDAAGGRVILAVENVRVESGDISPGDYVVVRVGDVGPGMTPEVQARAFEPFFTTKTVGRGSGLGLSMVHGFVTQSGGAVRIESVPGAGTTVRLFLPREAGPRPAEAVIPTPFVGSGEVKPARVLYVEDDADVRAAGIEVLRALGHTVLVACDGRQGLAVLRGGAEVDLLLSDVVMPGGLNGADLAAAARQLRPGLPVLLTSGYAAGALGEASEAYAFIAKPFDPATLAGALRTLLGRRAA
ncbi:MAG: PAS domain-containing protein [Acetobacteraceae bacterium]